MSNFRERNRRFSTGLTDMQMVYIEAERETDKLQAENAKLRKENERFIIKLNAEHIVRQNVEAENAKLRELARALLTCATEGECDECRMNGATPWHVGNGQLCDGVWEHLRELGVEVE